jgi:hypothetical protein
VTRDGKIDSGTGWVGRIEDFQVMIAVLERWIKRGAGQVGADIEYVLNGEVVK